MACTCSPCEHTSTRKVEFELHGMRPLISTSPWLRTSITSASAVISALDSDSDSDSRAAVAVDASAHVAVGVDRTTTDRAQRPAGRDELGCMGDEGRDLFTGEIEASGRGRDGIGEQRWLVVRVVIVLGDVLLGHDEEAIVALAVGNRE